MRRGRPRGSGRGARPSGSGIGRAFGGFQSISGPLDSGTGLGETAPEVLRRRERGGRPRGSRERPRGCRRHFGAESVEQSIRRTEIQFGDEPALSRGSSDADGAMEGSGKVAIAPFTKIRRRRGGRLRGSIIKSNVRIKVGRDLGEESGHQVPTQQGEQTLGEFRQEVTVPLVRRDRGCRLRGSERRGRQRIAGRPTNWDQSIVTPDHVDERSQDELLPRVWKRSLDGDQLSGSQDIGVEQIGMNRASPMVLKTREHDGRSGGTKRQLSEREMLPQSGNGAKEVSEPVVKKRKGRPPGTGKKQKMARARSMLTHPLRQPAVAGDESSHVPVGTVPEDDTDQGSEQFVVLENSRDESFGVDTTSIIMGNGIDHLMKPTIAAKESSPGPVGSVEEEVDQVSENFSVSENIRSMEISEASTSHHPNVPNYETDKPIELEDESSEIMPTEHEDDQENPEGESDELFVTDKFRAIVKDRLFSDLLNAVDDDESDEKKKRGRVNRPKETRSDKMRKIDNILQALESNYDEILTFEFFNFNGSEAGEVDAKVTIVLFMGDTLQEIRKVFDGSLKSAKEIGTNVRIEMFKSEDNFDAAFFVAEVGACYTARGRKGQEPVRIREQFFGVKPIGRLYEGDFVFDCISSGIHVISKDHACTKNLDFDVSSVENWIKNRSQIEDLWSKTRKLSLASETAFISYEMTDEHTQEDWILLEEKRQLMKRIYQEGEVENPVIFVDKALGKCMARTEFGRCPLTHSDYQDLEEHVKYLEWLIKDLDFEITDNSTVLVSKSVDKYETKAQGFTGTRSAAPGPIPDCEQLFPIYQEDVPYRTGKRNQNTWVRHKTPNNWVQKEAERRLKNLPDFPDELRPLSNLVNNFMLQDEFAYVGKLGVRRGMTKFFAEKEKEITETPNGLVLAISLACILLEKEIFIPEDYRKVFDRFTDLMIERQKAEGTYEFSDED